MTRRDLEDFAIFLAVVAIAIVSYLGVIWMFHE